MNDERLPTNRPRSASPLAMSADERERFLADAHVGVVAHGRADGATPLASPVWYSYAPGGDVFFVTAADSLKARHLAAEGRATFLVQQETPPQRFVSVSGSVRVDRGAVPEIRRAIAQRYLPDEAVDAFLDMTPGEVLVTVYLTPTTWRSSDFGKLAAAPASG